MPGGEFRAPVEAVTTRSLPKAALNAGTIIGTIDRTSRCASHRLRARLSPDPGHRGVTFLNGRDGDICRDCRKVGGQAAMAAARCRSLAAWKRWPKPVPSVPL